jgi:hypothetical protein
MRTLRLGLMLVGLLAVATPGMAQMPIAGSMDPLGLITSGAVLPYLGQGTPDGAMSFLEVYAPISSASVHMFFFTADCLRTGDSANIDLTPNDVEVFRLDDTGPSQPTSGLVTLGKQSADGFSLDPFLVPNVIQARVLWVNAAQDFARVLEPIAISTLDNERSGGGGTWSPLRTGATFFAPVETHAFHTTIYFVCPNTNIHGSSSSSAFPNSRFPQIVPAFAAPALVTSTPLRFLVYDDEENLLRDVAGFCNCLTIRPVSDISSVYADASHPDRVGTYTEVVGGTRGGTPAVCSISSVEQTLVVGQKNPGNVCDLVPTCVVGGSSVCTTNPGTQQFQQTTAPTAAGGPFSFTGYRAIQANGFDIFGRLSNGSKCDLQPGSSNCSTNGR